MTPGEDLTRSLMRVAAPEIAFAGWIGPEPEYAH